MTPGRLVLGVCFVGSSAVVLYGLFVDRTGSTIALTVAGLAVLGVTLAIMAISLAAGAVRQGRAGRGGRAVGAAFVGGCCALGSSGSLGAAVILGLLARPI